MFGGPWQSCLIIEVLLQFPVFQNKSTAHQMNRARTTWTLQGRKSEAQILSCCLFLYWFVHYLWSFTTVYNKYSLVLRCAVSCIVLPLFGNVWLQKFIVIWVMLAKIYKPKFKFTWRDSWNVGLTSCQVIQETHFLSSSLSSRSCYLL